MRRTAERLVLGRTSGTAFPFGNAMIRKRNTGSEPNGRFDRMRVHSGQGPGFAKGGYVRGRTTTYTTMTRNRSALGRVQLAAITVPLLLPSTTTLWGHGGTYPGPGDIVPPGAGGGGAGGGDQPGPGMPGPGPGSTPSPGSLPGSGPSPSPPGGGQGQPHQGPVTQRGDATQEDLTSWEFWWGYNREVYLGLKNRIHQHGVTSGDDEFLLGHGQKSQHEGSLAPDPLLVTNRVVPALLAALESERQDDVLTGALIALARIGGRLDEDGRSEIRDACMSFLTSPSQEVRETSVLALGILGDEAAVPFLCGVLGDRTDARRRMSRTQIDTRTRAFAGYALALIGHASSDPEVRRTIVAETATILMQTHFPTADVKVASMIAFGLVPLDPGPPLDQPFRSTEVPTTRQEQIHFLWNYLDPLQQRANQRSRKDVVLAHVPRAMARLLVADGIDMPEPEVLRELVARQLLEVIAPRGPYSSALIQQGAAMALGQIGTASDLKIDGEILQGLLDATTTGDQSVRRFAMISLAQAGSTPGPGGSPFARTADVRAHLERLHTRSKTNTRAWTVLALGVFGYHLDEAGVMPDLDVSLALRAAASKEGNPETIGAYAIALGLRKDPGAESVLLKQMERLEGRDTPRGYCAVGLGLLQASSAADAILDLVESSKYRPELLKQASTGLALLRQKRTVPTLIGMLSTTEAMATQAALCGALGRIGDRDAVEPLLELLLDKREAALTRGFAAVALGVVCDPSPLPWSVELSRDLPYRASTATLVGGGLGVLDIF